MTGTTEADIDLFFGWNERVLKKAMQIHYRAMNLLDRMNQAMVTCMV